MKKFTNIFFGFWSLLFILSAAVQYNDTDAWVWICIYLLAAILSGLVAFNRFPMVPLAVVTFLSLIGSIYFFPDSVGEWVAQEWQQKDLTMKTLAMEEARESFGLLLITIVLGLGLFFGWRKKGRLKSKYGSNYLGRKP
jgi:formate hydrogenlyase subunit 3/multisubunit Na+/H+ antiporter MnhD subunit